VCFTRCGKQLNAVLVGPINEVLAAEASSFIDL
jgi:hypothetical protein